MSILSDNAILFAMDGGDIMIEPFDRGCLGGNSYDVHLGNVLLTYVKPMKRERYNLAAGPLDCKLEHGVATQAIGEGGIVLEPGTLYLGSTIEYTETKRYVPYIDGKSSVGRLGISVHVTAGRGDVGFCGHWTLEITVVHAIRVYAGMPIGQITYHTVEGQVSQSYDRKVGGAGYGGRDPRPQPSRLWKRGW